MAAPSSAGAGAGCYEPAGAGEADAPDDVDDAEEAELSPEVFVPLDERESVR